MKHPQGRVTSILQPLLPTGLHGLKGPRKQLFTGVFGHPRRLEISEKDFFFMKFGKVGMDTFEDVVEGVLEGREVGDGIVHVFFVFFISSIVLVVGVVGVAAVAFVTGSLGTNVHKRPVVLPEK
jgi:hypothetical protein